ncbi:hypothetical protein JOC85_001843 [Bacillus mesophilus]|uniref:Uncharacterized protein n=1 Tax=Bacillus mesophilus TaxID=1808955 RepID=A0A6M0Q4U1_9BACI|nr:hypothetical protein [Bacillus mesophilus]NEY71395.1 hypothetical protein [Bacillus mesophilus]
MSRDNEEKMRRKELENNPMGAFSDAVNRSMVGEPLALVKGSCLTKIFTIVLIILGFIILSQCSF